jgi:hypothetical protein
MMISVQYVGIRVDENEFSDGRIATMLLLA